MFPIYAFWICLAIILYSYLLYGIIVWLLVNIFRKKPMSSSEIPDYTIPVTLLVAAFNEAEIAEAKVRDSLKLDYPDNLLNLVWVTDGSNDGTPDILAEFPQVRVLHEPNRRGKTAAINRAMKLIQDPLVVFCDANTMLASDSIRKIVEAFADPKVGCVAGEKYVVSEKSDSAAASGEGFYWKYESWLKKQDSLLWSTVGAAGELFAVRKELFVDVQDDTILDDFEISMRVAMKGYRIAYVPEAKASETGSENVAEEMKRKVRIAAGAWQVVFRLAGLLNVFKHGFLSWQYFSHKILRWVAVPFLLPVVFVLNSWIAWIVNFNPESSYTWLLVAQLIAYITAFLGYLLRNTRIRFRLIFVPYYLLMMNIAAWQGLFRYWSGRQSVQWERAKRSVHTE